jgi:predicted permease
VLGFTRDLQHAFRLLRKSPLFSLYVIAPLALGIGLNGAIFLLLDAFLLRPLPVNHPETLVRIAQAVQNIGIRSYYTLDALTALQKNSTSLTDILGYSDLNSAVRDASGASRVRVQAVTGNFFTALGVQSMRGRVLTESDASLPVVVLSYPYWRSHPIGIGERISLGDRPFTVAGVMPASFNGLEVETAPDIRIPMTSVDQLLKDPEQNSYRKLFYTLIARRKPGITLEQARTETARIVEAATDTKDRTQSRDERVEIEPISKGISIVRPKFASSLLLLMGGVGLLLAMICANVGGLLLARASARRDEAAVRLALGATASQLVRQWLTESLVLTLAGGIAGTLIAYASLPLLVHSFPTLRDLAATALTLSIDIKPDARFALFALLLCILCAVLAGLPAALYAMRMNLQTSLKAARTTLRQPLRWALVALQIGLCTFLLAGAGFLVGTFRHLRDMDPGFDRDHVVAFSLDPGMSHYSAEQMASLETRLLSAVRELPGVQSAGASVIGLMHGTGMKTTVAPAGGKVPRSEFMNTSLNWITPEYFESMGIPLLSGRNFNANEPRAKPELAVVNRAFVHRFFPTGDPIGQRFGVGADKIVGAEYQVVGVVGDAKYRSLREPIPPVFYHAWPPGSFSAPFILHVRTKNRPEGIIQAVRKALNEIDPSLPFYEVRSLSDEVDATLWAERLLAWLSTVFAVVAAILAAMGVYATLAYAVAQSKREIGIRVALGARSSDVLRLFSARPLRFTAAGVLAGITGFYLATPAFRSVLYDFSPTDPATMALSSFAVLAIALAATLVAVSGALRVDPAAVLRDE